MKILLGGAHGLIGSVLQAHLVDGGHEVVALTRQGGATSSTDETPGIAWNPPAGWIDRAALDRGSPFGAVVHLGGVGIGDKRWTDARRRELRASRIDSTELLAQATVQLEPPPDVFVAASAIGFYGDRGSETLTEESKAGTGFLAELCQDWEAATAPASEAGIRVVNVRSGIVLSARGGALSRQLPLFRLGLGGRLGSGRQFLSWISLDDELGIIRRAIEDPALSGPLNATAPQPVTNATFTKVLGRVLHRPAPWRVPRPALALALGSDLTDEMLLASQYVLPMKLTSAGHRFAHSELGAALVAAMHEH